MKNERNNEARKPNNNAFASQNKNRDGRENREPRDNRGGKAVPPKNGAPRKQGESITARRIKTAAARRRTPRITAKTRTCTRSTAICISTLRINAPTDALSACATSGRAITEIIFGSATATDAEKVIAAINGMGDIKKFKEVVFCGFGEPTYKVAEMCAVAEYVHEKGLTTRLNTNGQGNLVNKRDILPELKGKIDKINISLNASCAEKYQPICRSMFGEAGYTGDSRLRAPRQEKRHRMLVFRGGLHRRGRGSGLQRVADSVGIPLRVRAYIADS